MRWTILPPQFYEYLVDSCNKDAHLYIKGKFQHYPSFFEVDYVFLPLCLDDRDWLLVRIDLRTQEMLMYFNKDMGSSYRQVLFPILKRIQVYFAALLVNIKYWKKTHYHESVISWEAIDDYVIGHRDLAGNEGVLVCMLLEHLVTGAPLDLTANAKEQFMNYRRYMADQFYFWRCLPRY